MSATSSWNFDSVPATFKCDLCLQHKSEAPIKLIETSAVCRECFITQVKPKFEAAKASEQNWPVTFGTPIHPSSFPDFFTTEFIEDYEEKEKEYKTPVNSRVYCAAASCGAFLGSSGAGASITCACGTTTCTQCKAAVQQGVAHSCRETNAFEGLELGRHYQLCPACGVAVELVDACAHIQCRCGHSFCFRCGQSAAENSGHWRSGGCPRYNHRDDSNAQYDPPQAQYVEQLLPERGPMPDLLAQAMDALATDRSPPAQPPARQQAPQGPSEEQLRERAEIQRRAMNDMAARMGFTPTRGRGRGRR